MSAPAKASPESARHGRVMPMDTVKSPEEKDMAQWFEVVFLEKLIQDFAEKKLHDVLYEAEDRARIERKRRREDDLDELTPETKRRMRVGASLERTLPEIMQDFSYLGYNAYVSPSSGFDDQEAGADTVIEFPSKAGISLIAIDITVSENLADTKLVEVVDHLRRGQLTDMKYFASQALRDRIKRQAVEKGSEPADIDSERDAEEEAFMTQLERSLDDSDLDELKWLAQAYGSPIASTMTREAVQKRVLSEARKLLQNDGALKSYPEVPKVILFIYPDTARKLSELNKLDRDDKLEFHKIMPELLVETVLQLKAQETYARDELKDNRLADKIKQAADAVRTALGEKAQEVKDLPPSRKREKEDFRATLQSMDLMRPERMAVDKVSKTPEQMKQLADLLKVQNKGIVKQQLKRMRKKRRRD